MPTFGEASIEFPTKEKNYCTFDEDKVNYLVAQREQAIPSLKNTLRTSNDEGEIVEALYVLNRLADNNVKGIPAMYPILARFNYTKSPNIQVFLAGVYRKTQVPDAFGPLVAMLIEGSKNKKEAQLFDPNEEIGGAILEYIRNYSSGTPKKIDYSI